MAQHLILLVDDNTTHQYSLSRHLEQSGFEVLQAHSGAVALETARERHPDVVLLDINLPDTSGFDVCQALKDNPQTATIPVIFHSATHDTASARARAADLGAVSFLSYPIDVDHLVNVVKGAIARGRRTI